MCLHIKMFLIHMLSPLLRIPFFSNKCSACWRILPSDNQVFFNTSTSKKQTPLLLCYMYLIPVNDRKWDNNKKNSNQRCPETLLYLSKEARFFFVWNSCVAVTPVSCVIMHPWCTWVLQEKEAAGLAQSVEQLTAERDVVSLIPGTGPIHS